MSYPGTINQMKAAPTVPTYRVQLVPRPIVIDAGGLPVSNSHVIEIVFPGDTVDTLLGRVNTIVGAGSAKILVGEATIRGGPLC